MKKNWKKILGAIFLAGIFLKIKKKFSQKKISKNFAPINFQKNKIRGEKFCIFEFFKKNRGFAAFCGIAILSIFLAQFFEDFAKMFRASLIELKPIEFAGTKMPVEKVPNWVALSDAERKMSFSQIPENKKINLPEYKISDFQNGKNFSGKNTDERNSYITFSVPYLGNYKLDGTENSGSHPGIDIKLPIGTPIFSIANGIVSTAKEDATGAGKHIVIVHAGVPDPKNPEKKITINSIYEHLSEIKVKNGEEVKKGQIIGLSGASGMATAPHLHFQIDFADAPFHPYWPFSWNDVQNAGISSYFEAVKKGLGVENAKKYTLHPMEFVKKFENFTPENLVATAGENLGNLSSENNSEKILENKNSENIKKNISENSENQNLKNDEKNLENLTNAEKKFYEKKQENFSEQNLEKKIFFETEKNFSPGKEKIVKIKILDENLVASAGIEISSTLKNLAEISPQKISAKNLKNGVAEIRVRTNSARDFKLIANGNFGEIKSELLRAEIFADVAAGDKFADAIAFLKNKKIIEGNPDGTFRPNDFLNRAESVKILLIANKIEIKNNSTNFSDVKKNAWFEKYVATAVEKEIVRGYPDGTFQPNQTISRAEFSKIAILTAGFSPGNPENNPFEDVPKNKWFAPFFNFVKKNFLLEQKNQKIFPAAKITRGEAANMIFKISQLKKI